MENMTLASCARKYIFVLHKPPHKNRTVDAQHMIVMATLLQVAYMQTHTFVGTSELIDRCV